MPFATSAYSARNASGFTLLELMVTVALAGILIMIAVPSFSEMIKNNRLSAQINELTAATNLARSEAIKRNQPVTICRSASGTACAAGWPSSTNGWLVFVNPNNNSSLDGGEEILRVNKEISGNNTLKYSSSLLTYTPQGDVPTFNGTFVLCDDRGATQAKGLIVLPSGLTRKAVDNNNDNLVEDINGTNVTCP